MSERAPYFDTPDRCDGCLTVKALAEVSKSQPIKISEVGADRMAQLFDDCPGYREGILGLMRTMRLQFRESLTYGGPIIDGSSGTMHTRFTLRQPAGCGMMIRELVETFESVPLYKGER